MSRRKRNFLNHLHPQKVRRKTLNPWTTLGLGTACLTCIGILFVTGLTLFLYYVPDREQAYERILHISTTLRYGRTVRNLHYVTANVLIILSAAHLARVFVTGSYKGHRICWLYGLSLFLLLCGANFTGYLLSWDQVSYWAVKVGAGLAGYVPIIGDGLQRFLLAGEEIGGDTLARAFAFHAGIIPLGLLILTSLHLWRLRKEGGLALPPDSKSQLIPAHPWLYRAEGAVALWTFASLVFLSHVMDAPIHGRADPMHPPNPAKAPWYFIGFQEMVSYSAFLGGVVAPLILLLFFVLVPLLDRTQSPGGVWFAKDRRVLNVLFLCILLSQVTFIIIGLWFRGKNWSFQTVF